MGVLCFSACFLAWLRLVLKSTSLSTCKALLGSISLGACEALPGFPNTFVVAVAESHSLVGQTKTGCGNSLGGEQWEEP